MEKRRLENFRADYAGLLITSNVVEIELTEYNPQMFPLDTPFTSVISSLFLTNENPQKVLNGNLMVVIRNQAPGSKMSASVSGLFTIRCIVEMRAAQMVALLIEYIFMYTDKYFKDHYIKESPGVDFIFPAFLYSSANFETDYPEN